MDDVAVHRAEREVAALGQLAHLLDVFKKPRKLRCREVRRERQACHLLDVRGVILCQPLAYSAAACALPDDGVSYGGARRAMPGERRLALVADADGSDFFARQMLLFEHFSDK